MDFDSFLHYRHSRILGSGGFLFKIIVVGLVCVLSRWGIKADEREGSRAPWRQRSKAVEKATGLYPPCKQVGNDNSVIQGNSLSSFYCYNVGDSIRLLSS